jgi:transcriptional regulator with XRE-family HTH domain
MKLAVTFLSSKGSVMKVMTNLRQVREGIGLSLEGLARRAGVSSRTIRNAEEGKRISFETAVQIIQGLNSALADVGRPPVTADDLGLTL